MQIIAFLHGADLSAEWEIKKKSEKRTLTQNSYYWVLLSKVAESLGNSKNVQHNLILRDYGQRVIVDGHTVLTPIPDTDEAAEAVLKAETYHLKPTSQVKEGTDGIMYRTHVLLKGSHELDTREFKYLLDGLIKEAENLGIETLTPAERERLK